jgi:hypothetical protein
MDADDGEADHQDTKDTKITKNGGGRVNGPDCATQALRALVHLVPWCLGGGGR